MRMLFDNGLTPSKPPKYPLKSPPLDLAFLSHAHIDHSGMMPWVTSHYGIDVITTPPTTTVGGMLLEDTVKVSASEGYPVPYEKRDVRAMRRHFQHADFNDVIEVGDTEIELHSAGHIPGAAMFEVRGERNVLITADINTLDTRLVGGASPVKCDILIMESTYSGRNHPPRSETERDFLTKVEEVVDRGGVAIVPSFAVGRTQEMMMVLKDSGHEIWLDGLGKAVNSEYMKHEAYLRSAVDLGKAMSSTRVVRHRDERKTAAKGDVIITTSGMLDGGPVLEYLRMMKDDEKSAVLLTGFQVENTNGRQLLETGTIKMHEVPTRIKCEVCFYDFSAHADHDELISFARACEPEKIVLSHGDDRATLANALGEFEVLCPVEGEAIPS